MSVSADEKTQTEMEEAPSLASSVPVPNVQEMVRKDPLGIPQRYTRTQQEMDNINYMPSLSSDIPIIDLALLSLENQEELFKLDAACKNWGFFQLVNHGVKKEVHQRMKDGASEFFKLGIEEKNKYAMPCDDIQGYGHAYVVSEDQTLDWSDTLIFLVHPTNYRKLQLWPKTPQGFKERIEEYSSGVRRVGEEILGCLSVIMGMQKHVLPGLHREIVQALRVNYYPPCSMPGQVLGLSPHSDTSTVTILMQDEDVCGLEIRHKGKWVPVTPLSDALVVNIGDVIEIWSNGKYKSVEHRAMTNKKKERCSYASFIVPVDDVVVEPLEQMVNAERHKMYREVRYGDYMRQAFKQKMEGKAHIDFAKILI